MIGGGKFANGAITEAYVMLFNELKHDDNEKIRKYVDKMFPDRIPEGANVVFSFNDGEEGLTNGPVLNHRGEIKTSIPRHRQIIMSMKISLQKPVSLKLLLPLQLKSVQRLILNQTNFLLADLRSL